MSITGDTNTGLKHLPADDLSVFLTVASSSSTAMLESLSREQSRTAISILTSKGTAVVTGQAGAGKSWLISALARMTDRGGAPLVFVTATIGKVALMLEAPTIDSLCCIRRQDWSIFSARKLEENMAVTPQNIVIDEGSFIGTNMGNLLDEIAKDFNKRFIIVGDFAQARPVKDGPFLDSTLATDYNFYKLWENHRQADTDFIEVLNEIRVGAVSRRAREMFEPCVSPKPPSGDSWLRLYGTNNKTETYNNARLWAHVSAAKVKPLQMETTFEDMRPAPTQRRYPYDKKRIDRIIRDSPFGHTDMWVAPGCRVVITANTQTGAVNGDTGALLDYVCTRGTQEAVVQLDRCKHPTPIPAMTRVLHQPDGTATASVTGVPLRLGYAMTIHKAQGMTVSNVWFDMGSLGPFPSQGRHGLAYVALSRVRAREGLRISQWIPEYVYCDPAVTPLL